MRAWWIYALVWTAVAIPLVAFNGFVVRVVPPSVALAAFYVGWVVAALLGRRATARP